jgi:hypothetical protein
VIKKTFVLFFIIILQITYLLSIELIITNDIPDIIESKKICARLNFDTNDQAIHSNSLNFSIDCPFSEIESWSCNKNPSIQYIHSFRRTKKVYSEPPSCELILKFDSDDKKAILKNLYISNLYASCIVLDKNGTSNAKSLVKSLDNGFSIIDTFTFSNKISYDSIQTLTSDFLKNKNLNQKFNNSCKQKIDVENSVADNLRDIWNKLALNIAKFDSFLNSILNFIIILVFLVFLILLRFKIDSILVTELYRFILICCIIWGYSFLRLVVRPHFFFLGFAILLTPISFYYIFADRTGSTLCKLKSFIGLVLAASIIPILVKAYISLMFF